MRPRTHRPRRPAAVLATLVMVAIVAVAASLAGVARADIVDDGADPSWTLMFANPGDDFATDVAMTATVTWVCGQEATPTSGMDATLIRVVNATSVNVPHSYDGPAHLGDFNNAVAVRGTAVYTTGSTWKTAANRDLLVARWSSATGALKWARTWGSGGDNLDRAIDVGVDGKQNVVACGTRRGTTEEDWVVASWSPAGKRRWVWTYNGPADLSDMPRELWVDKAGNTYVTGIAWFTSGGRRCVTVKLSPAGKRLWLKTYSGPDGAGADGRAIAACPSGGVYVGGFAVDEGAGIDAMLLRYGATGKRKVYAAYTGGGASPSEEIDAIAVLRGGAVVGVGRAVNATDDPLRVVWDPGGAVVDYDVDETVVPYEDEWVDVAADSSGGYCMTGIWPNAPGNLAIRTRRLSPRMGAGRWGYVWDGPVDTTANSPYAVAVNGTCYAVVGTYESSTTGMNQFIQFWRY